eukprot:7148854-Prymnesium_polylepis.2
MKKPITCHIRERVVGRVYAQVKKPITCPSPAHEHRQCVSVGLWLSRGHGVIAWGPVAVARG